MSFALAGIRESQPSPVKSVTLLEAAYSRFAFAHDLPSGGCGALDGKLARVDGPLTVCFSSHDKALSLFYPLASAAAGDAKAGADDPLARFRAMGSLGAFNVEPQMLGKVGTSYPFKAGEILTSIPPMSSSRATPRRVHTATFSTSSSPGLLPRRPA